MRNELTKRITEELVSQIAKQEGNIKEAKDALAKVESEVKDTITGENARVEESITKSDDLFLLADQKLAGEIPVSVSLALLRAMKTLQLFPAQPAIFALLLIDVRRLTALTLLTAAMSRILTGPLLWRLA